MAGSKIGEDAFMAASGVLFGIAVTLGLERICIRVSKFHRLFLDDYFLFLAIATLTAGTAMMFVNIPLAYVQIDVEAGVEAPPPGLVDQLIQDEKTQDASVVLLTAAIFSVKFSFMCFFRLLLQRLSRWYIWWWWTVFIIMIPSAIISMCSNFISCPTFGPAVLQACTTPGALNRENGALIAVTTLDIATDVLLISIPVMLLWRVQISLRRKLALGLILCLSIFTFVCSLIRVSTGKTTGGQVDTTWVLFWLEIEACVAVIVVSAAAFRTLFTTQNSSKTLTPGHTDNSYNHARHHKFNRPSHETTYPMAVYNGGGESVRDPTVWGRSSASGDVSGVLDSRGITVTHDIATQRNPIDFKQKRSYESFV